MKKFFAEFKTFISRGNVMEMAVGVIIGGAFSAIVNSLTNSILKPLINAVIYLIAGGNDATDIYTFLVKNFAEDGSIDLATSIYINWGEFINAILNFLLIAIVLFLIVKAFNAINSGATKLSKHAKRLAKKELRAELKAHGISWKDTKAVEQYLADKAEVGATDSEVKE